jgi:hypothetical protein
VSNIIGAIEIAILTTATCLLAGSTTVMAADSNLKSDLVRVADKRVLFGHQSVGVNILDGINQVAHAEGVRLRVTEVSSTKDIGPTTLAHTFVAENGNPAKKFASFESAMSGSSEGPDIALIKLCFVDFSPETDVSVLFSQYQEMIKRLKLSHPETTFVHVTTPLTVVQGGIKGWVKRLIGRAPAEFNENVRRNDYNELLRKTYGGREPIFDLAHLESLGPDGKTLQVEWHGKVVPALIPDLSSDGGHLNAEGQRRAAVELLSALAHVPDQHNKSRRVGK